MDAHRAVLAERVPYLENILDGVINEGAVFKLSWPQFPIRYNHFIRRVNVTVLAQFGRGNRVVHLRGYHQIEQKECGTSLLSGEYAWL